MKSNSTLNKAGTKVHKFFKHHENTVIAGFDRKEDNFLKNAVNKVKLRKKATGGK